MNSDIFIRAFSKIFQVEKNVLQAIVNIESRAAAFDEKGRLVIRFEAHIFLGKVPGAHEFFSLGNPYWLVHYYNDNGQLKPVHASPDSEWAAFNLAKSISEEYAYQSISMGLAQVMGFNYGLLGYGSAKEMFNDFSNGEIEQLTGMFAFLYSKPGLIAHIRNKQWSDIALIYNGSGNVDVYSRLFIDEYNSLS